MIAKDYIYIYKINVVYKNSLYSHPKKYKAIVVLCDVLFKRNLKTCFMCLV